MPRYVVVTAYTGVNCVLQWRVMLWYRLKLVVNTLCTACSGELFMVNIILVSTALSSGALCCGNGLNWCQLRYDVLTPQLVSTALSSGTLCCFNG